MVQYKETYQCNLLINRSKGEIALSQMRPDSTDRIQQTL